MEPLTLAYLLIALGLALLLAELFLPTSGFLFLMCGVCILVGVVLTFVYGDTNTGVVTVLVVFLAVPAVGVVAMYLWPRSPLGRRLVLPDQDATVATMPVNLELEALRGRYGRALSDLRPAGVVDFEGRRVDTVTEGMMVTAGSWVRCVDVKAGRVVVRPVDKPDLGELENADFGS